MWELSVVPSVRALDGLVFLFVCTTPDEGNFREGKDLLRLMDMGEGYSSSWWGGMVPGLLVKQQTLTA